MKKFAGLLVGLFVSSLVTTALAGMSLDDLINKVQSNQGKIKDMYAETVTVITSNIQLPTSKQSGPQKMEQKGKMWTKGEDKSRIEMTSPMKQVTVTNGDKMMMVNSETGQKVIQDLKKLREKEGMQESSRAMSVDKMKEYFDLSVAQKGGEYIITGIPKKNRKFIGKMEFYVDGRKWVPVKIMMYDTKGKMISQSELAYSDISGVWIPTRNTSNVTTPAGTMKVEMEFKNVRVNKGISDDKFKID